MIFNSIDFAIFLPIVFFLYWFVVKFAKEKEIEYFGSFSPQKAGVDNTDFYDGMHCKEHTIKKIMKVRTHNKGYKSLVSW